MSVPDTLRSGLADRYVLDRELGRGGMATVYLGRDVRHHREVAVKVLRQELAETLGADRFLREIEIAARLNHPHIVPLLDSADVHGTLLYVMPYIDGESLRSLLNRKAIPERTRALRWTAEIADALGYAHRQGVVHRDIKPENVLLSEGHAVVADFGIARAVSTLGGRTLTRTGFPIGTPGYMSPEQAAGLTDLDERTDIYSLACVLYEMLVGDTPGFWPSEEALRMRRFIEALPKHRERLDLLPGAMEQVLVRALALRPEDRFGSTSEFMEALHDAGSGRKPRYDTAQVDQIVGEAARLETNTTLGDRGLSLGGIQQIGAEVGIPPEQVERALRRLGASDRSVNPAAEPPPVGGLLGSDRSKWKWFFGELLLLRFERIVDGEVPEREFPYIVEDIEATLGNVGNVNVLGKTLTWRADTASLQGRVVHVSVVPRAGATRIRVEERLHRLAGGMYGGVWGGLGGGFIAPAIGVTHSILSSVWVAGAAGVGVVAGAYALARTIFVSTARRRREELSDLFERVVAHAEDTAVVAATPSGA